MTPRPALAWVCGLALLLATAAAQAQSDWKAKADPPAKPPADLSDKTINIPVPDSFFDPEVAYADGFGRFVAGGRSGRIARRVVMDLRDGKQVGALAGEIRIEKPAALTADGATLAIGESFGGNGVRVYDMKTG